MSNNKITDLIGNTPLVEIRTERMHPDVHLFAKLEGQNPGGSVKDRPAYNMINSALKNGIINHNTKLVEATSGNTGIALAMICSSLGINITLIMPASASEERKKVMRAYGATLIETDPSKTIEYSRSMAKDMVLNEGYVQLDQFNNSYNPEAHFLTTGPEIWRDTNGAITHFVSSMGTTGTIMGCSRFLKSKNPQVQIIGVQPKEGSRIPGIRKWSKEFLPSIFEEKRVDKIELVSAQEAKIHANEFSSKFGIFAGMSSGGAGAIALKLAENLKEKANIVFIVCDRGDRYLSTDLYN